MVALHSHAPTLPKAPVTSVTRAPRFLLAPEPLPAQPCLGGELASVGEFVSVQFSEKKLTPIRSAVCLGKKK
jgi:hypothetical protein